jgi:tripartite-type tricarboxylate transporter receptor subunit TctC
MPSSNNHIIVLMLSSTDYPQAYTPIDGETTMSPFRNVGLASGLLLSAYACGINSALSEDFPNKPVSIITAAGAGSAPDVIARVLADSLSRQWKQQVLVMNRPGGSGVIAAQAAARAPDDGHTFFMALSSAFVVLPESKTKPPVNLATDFTTIGLIADQPMAIAVSPKLGVNTLAELIALAKRRPNEILYGATRLSVPHMTGELLNLRAGIQLGYVPTVGAAKVVQDILNGSLHVYVDSVPGMAGAVHNGTLKALAVADDRRLDNYPDLPLASETLPGFQAKGWFVLMAPAKTPVQITNKLSTDLRSALNDPELTKRLETLGTFAHPLSAQQTLAYIQAEQKLWRPIVREIGVD